jgi:hypothetical protein
LFVVLILLTLTALPIRATGAESLALDAAIELAARQNPDVLRARAAIEAASGRKLQAESFADPRLVYEPEEAGANPGAIWEPEICEPELRAFESEAARRSRPSGPGQSCVARS